MTNRKHIEIIQKGEPLTLAADMVAYIHTQDGGCHIEMAVGGTFRADGETVETLLQKYPEAFARFHRTRGLRSKGEGGGWDMAINPAAVSSIGVHFVQNAWRPVMGFPGQGAPALDMTYDEARALVGLPPSTLPLPEPKDED